MADTDSLAKYETIKYKILDAPKLNVFRNQLNKVVTEPSPTLLFRSTSSFLLKSLDHIGFFILYTTLERDQLTISLKLGNFSKQIRIQKLF